MAIKGGRRGVRAVRMGGGDTSFFVVTFIILCSYLHHPSSFYIILCSNQHTATFTSCCGGLGLRYWWDG